MLHIQAYSCLAVGGMKLLLLSRVCVKSKHMVHHVVASALFCRSAPSNPSTFLDTTSCGALAPSVCTSNLYCWHKSSRLPSRRCLEPVILRRMERRLHVSVQTG